MRASRGWIVPALALLGAACGRSEAPPPLEAPTEAEMSKPLPDPLPQVAAVVNGQEIPTRNIAFVARQAMTSERLPEEKKPFLYRDAMYKLIVRELLYQEAAARRLSPDAKALEKAYDEAHAPYKDEKAWSDMLALQGLDPQAFRTELRIQHTIRALIEQEASRVPQSTDQEAQAFYQANPSLFDSGERLRASHILIRVPAEAPLARKEELRTRAEGILARIRSGESFAALAKKHSEDVGSSGKGGDLGIFSRGQLPKPFDEAAYALKAGEVSNVVESPFGFHIIELQERLPALKLAFDQVKGQVKLQLDEQRRQKNLEGLVTNLKAKARIETHL